MLRSLVGSEMCIRDRDDASHPCDAPHPMLRYTSKTDCFIYRHVIIQHRKVSITNILSLYINKEDRYSQKHYRVFSEYFRTLTVDHNAMYHFVVYINTNVPIKNTCLYKCESPVKK